jgi:hypothetical protein
MQIPAYGWEYLFWAGMTVTSPQQKVLLISNGDYRDTACAYAWPKQEETLRLCHAAFTKLGVETEVLPRDDHVCL